MFDQILVPTDGSPSSLLAVRFAGLICGSGGGVRLLHVTTGVRDLAAYGIDTVAGMAGGIPGDLHSQIRLTESAEAARLLEQARKALPAGLRIETQERQGTPGSTILDEVERDDIDSVVLGSRGRGAIARAFFGSAADTVVRHARKPVLVARRTGARQLCVGIDGSEASFRAAGAGARLALKMGASLALVQIMDVPGAAREVERVREAAAAQLARARDEVRGVSAELRIDEISEVGEAAHGLLDVAGRTGADLIVLGRQGRRSDPRLPIGSVAHRIATHADASVLVVP